jgi:selenocysteine lyase/cysteine desulfurase
MTSRRQFIKAAGLLGGMTTLPALGFGNTRPEITRPSALLEASTDDELFRLVRKQLLVPENRIYLNTGSLGPSLSPVIDTVTTLMRQLEMNPVGENWGPLGNQMEGVRKKVADFIHADVEEVLITRNTTEGLSLIGQSLNLNKGDEMLTTTDEHGGGEVGFDYLASRKGATFRKFDMPLPAMSREEVIQTVEKNITSRTKLIMLSHINTSSGMLMPFEEISKITQAKGIYLISDGAQAPGLTPVDVKALGVDAYAASGHKWMLGPKETGFLYLKKSFQDKVQPVFSSSGFATYTASSGTRNVAVISGLGAAIDWINLIGMQKIQQRCLETRNYCLGELKKLQGLKIISPEVPSLSTGIVSFSLEKAKNADIFNKLKDQDIIVKLLSKHNAIRISCHMFVSREDIDTFVKALKPLL